MKTKIVANFILVVIMLAAGSAFSFEGASDTLYGSNAGGGSTSDDKNATVIGSEAGSSITTGTNNTFVGYRSGFNTTYGNRNTFLGREAGYSNTSGTINTFIGNQAGYTNDSGWYNVFIGNESGRSNVTGSDNTLIGDAAGYSNTSGSWNMFLGSSAGYNNETGQENTFIGDYAGWSNIAGIQNIYIGNEAGYNSTGSYNVFIGNKAGTNETGSNRLYIDNSDTSSPLIYGKFDTDILTVNGKLGVGTTTPSSPFTVAGVIELTSGWIKFPDGTELGTASTGSSPHVHSGADITSGTVAETYIDPLIARDSEVAALVDAHAARTDNPLNVTLAQIGAADLTHSHDAAYVSTSGDTINGNLLVYGVVDIDQDLYVVGNIYAESDTSSKEEIRPLDSSLQKIKHIQGVSFRWKDGEHSNNADDAGSHYGVIAQEVEEVLPELVKTGSNGKKKFAYMELIPLLIEAVKEQQSTSRIPLQDCSIKYMISNRRCSCITVWRVLM